MLLKSRKLICQAESYGKTGGNISGDFDFEKALAAEVSRTLESSFSFCAFVSLGYCIYLTKALLLMFFFFDFRHQLYF